MGDRDERHPSNSTRWRPAWRALAWLLLSVAATALLAYVAAHLPRKPIALVALAYAALATWVLLWLAGELRLNSRSRLLVAAAGLVLAGQIGVAWESHRVFASAVRTYWGPDPRAGMLSQMRRSQTSAEDIAVMEAAIAERRRALAARTSFSAWLRHRLSQVTRFSPGSLWPAVTWAVELLVGTAAGLWIGWRLNRWSGTVPNRSSPPDSDAPASP